MTIEIDARILRGSCMPVYFVGETIECEVRFKCLPSLASASKKRVGSSSSSSSINSSDVVSSTSTSMVASTATRLLSNLSLPNVVKYVDLNSQAGESDSSSVTTAATPNNLVDEINQSMFSLLATYPSTSSNASSSMATTPTDASVTWRPQPQSKSINTIAGTRQQQQPEPNIELVDDQAECIIAWACVQIDCNCYIDESKVALPKIPLRYYNVYTESEAAAAAAAAAASTSFQPNRDRHGLSVYSSKPKILFCNLCLRPNEEKSFIYRETLPYDLAPSFRGQFARYTYKLTIGAQKLNRNTQLLRLPFKVYSLLDFDKFIPKSDSSENGFVKTKRESILSTEIADTAVHAAQDQVKEKPNPFKVEEKSQFENLEYALQILEDLTSRLNTTHFNVANEDGKIAKVTLNKMNYKIGDKLIVFLDFSEAQVPCIEFKVTLQSEEVIAEECRKKPNQILSSITSHSELQEHTLFMKKANFTMQIPANVTPTFVSDIISLRWRLHFDFALSKTPIQKIYRSNDPVMSLSWRPPGSLNVHVTSWDLPITLHAFDPFLASDLIMPTSNENNTLVLR